MMNFLFPVSKYTMHCSTFMLTWHVLYILVSDVCSLVNFANDSHFYHCLYDMKRKYICTCLLKPASVVLFPFFIICRTGRAAGSKGRVAPDYGDISILHWLVFCTYKHCSMLAGHKYATVVNPSNREKETRTVSCM